MHLTLKIFNLLSVLALVNAADRFPLSIVHINDFHARFESTDANGGFCDDESSSCIGGYARTVYTVKRLLKEHEQYNPVFLNAGDNFQGTIWYNIGRWNVTCEFLNMLPADALTLGNHEFDNEIKGVVPFLECLKSPVLVANMDASLEPSMLGKYEKSMIIERGGRKIGIVGLILETTYNIASTGNLIFSNETEVLRQEAAALKAQGANIIIALTHCGYDVDKEIARYANTEVDIIVGAHSHTYLYTGTPPDGYPTRTGGDYPTIVQHASGHRVLIVQAYAYARFVGNIRVYFDDDGEIMDWEGSPIFMSADVPEDEAVKEAIKPWKKIMDEEGKVLIGNTVVDLEKENCYSKECSLGNFFTDALIHSFLSDWSYDSKPWGNVAVALTNPGGLRIALLRGNLTYSHLLTMTPFENQVYAFDLPGEKLKAALERGVEDGHRTMLQVSGLRVTYDMNKPSGQRAVNIQVKCVDCDYPKFEPFVPSKIYRVTATSFLADGGDGFEMLRESTNRVVGVRDIDAVVKYTSSISPIYTGLEKRIVVIPANKNL